ncbi:hypothetical protein NDU88_005611 [Pleurodeles waltl]|uniref:Uncharacterized protein n=1 Tax=Pleurodeles waltl TaxID=8319 RepID=A0AAV7PG25_PLEWA|nr:hypothetical protein NDU88_005611 [Pleurodeles waltl]
MRRKAASQLTQDMKLEAQVLSLERQAWARPRETLSPSWCWRELSYDSSLLMRIVSALLDPSEALCEVLLVIAQIFVTYYQDLCHHGMVQKALVPPQEGVKKAAENAHKGDTYKIKDYLRREGKDYVMSRCAISRKWKMAGAAQMVSG